MAPDRPQARRDGHHKPALAFLLRHLIVGTIAGFVLGGLLLWQDVAGLGTMIRQSPDGWLFAVMLFFGLFITFGSVAMAVGVMGLGKERD